MGGVFEACRYSFVGIRGRVGERGYGVVDGRRGKSIGGGGFKSLWDSIQRVTMATRDEYN